MFATGADYASVTYIQQLLINLLYDKKDLLNLLVPIT